MKKRAAFLCMITFFALKFLIPSPAIAAVQPSFEGRGEESDPYVLSTENDLRQLAALVNAGDNRYAHAYYILDADIYMQKEFIPIGNNDTSPFMGHMDGQGHIISNLSIPTQEFLSESQSYCGFLGILDGGSVSNLTVLAENIRSDEAGILVGYNKNGIITNCVTGGKLSAVFTSIQTNCCGGIVAVNDGGTIENCCFNGELVPKSYIEGAAIAGANINGGRIENCFYWGKQNIHVAFVYGGGSPLLYCYTNTLYMPQEDTGSILGWYNNNECGLQMVGDASEYAKEGDSLCDALNAWVVAHNTEGNKYHAWLSTPDAGPLLADNTLQIEYEIVDYPYPDDVKATITIPLLDGCPRTLWLNRMLDGYKIVWAQLNGDFIPISAPSYLIEDPTESYFALLHCERAGSMDHFQENNFYSGYPDIVETAWYGLDGEGTVATATRLGFFVGDDSGRFRPDAAVSLGEAIKLAAVIRNTYYGAPYLFDQNDGEYWFDTYLNYLLGLGYFSEEQFDDYFRPATRGEVAFLFAKVLPDFEYEVVSNWYPNDILPSTNYYEEIYRLFISGILQGTDMQGNFYPDRTVSRAEIASILVRLAVPESRIKNNHSTWVD